MSIEIRLSGVDGTALVSEAEGVLRAAAGTEPERRERKPVERVTRGDPVAIAALVLSVPGAIMSLLDLAERARLAERVRGLLARVRSVEGHATLHVPGAPPLDLAAATEDEVMDRLAQGSDSRSGAPPTPRGVQPGGPGPA
jgi:hypothetical protein